MITNNTLEPVIDAFTEIERHDIRVGRIELTREDYYKLATSREFLLHGCNNPELMGEKITKALEGYRYIGELWGAGITLINQGKSKVYGERGYHPKYKRPRPLLIQSLQGNLEYMPVSEFTPAPQDIEYSVEIKFDGLKYRLKYLKNNLTIIVKSRADFLRTYPKSEWTAIETLREMITEKEFRKYITYGFILVKGSSGNTYQIFRNRHHTKVWRNGKVIEEVCVRISSEVKAPPTDNVIAFKTIIETDENEFKKLGNVYKMVA